MSVAVFIDTEATGLHEPEPIEVTTYFTDTPRYGSFDKNGLVIQRLKPSKDIELGAMATHHIIPWDLTGCPPSSTFQLISTVDYLVGHNVDYDWQVIREPDVKRICTLAMARRLWPDLSTHRLSALMYHCFGANAWVRDIVKRSHGSMADVLMLGMVFTRMMDEEPFKHPGLTWESVWLYSEEARIPERIDFGKHGPKPEEGRPQGMLIEEMRRTDPGYVKWLLANACDDKPYLRKALTR